jgi:hypothetical protein
MCHALVLWLDYDLCPDDPGLVVRPRAPACCARQASPGLLHLVFKSTLASTRAVLRFHVTVLALPGVRHVRVARPAPTARRAAGDHGAGAAQRAAPLAPGHLPACAAAARAHGGRGPRGPSTR